METKTTAQRQNIFKINNKDFEIAQAYIDAILDDENEVLLFGLEIEGVKVDNYTFPCITSDTVLRVKKNEIKKWQDIAGKVIEWEKIQKNVWKPHLKFLNFYKKSYRANFVYNVKIEFANIYNKIYVRINGLCDSKWNGKEVQTLTLEIETEIFFRGINYAPNLTDEEMINDVKPYIDTKYLKIKRENGIDKLIPL
jgi:hypothetical protein